MEEDGGGTAALAVASAIAGGGTAAHLAAADLARLDKDGVDRTGMIPALLTDCAWERWHGATSRAAYASAPPPTQLPIKVKVLAECQKTRARALDMVLPHGPLRTPVFMPVGTQGTIKGLLPKQMVAAVEKKEEAGQEEEDEEGNGGAGGGGGRGDAEGKATQSPPPVHTTHDIILGNTYHLALRPGTALLRRQGGLHSFMRWPNNILTDSGGFQMVSLLALADITERGVHFQSPADGTQMLVRNLLSSPLLFPPLLSSAFLSFPFLSYPFLATPCLVSCSLLSHNSQLVSLTVQTTADSGRVHQSPERHWQRRHDGTGRRRVVGESAVAEV